ncbi:hypothetical protein JCM11251_002111 [Rhodosporidiobolus azoricus]
MNTTSLPIPTPPCANPMSAATGPPPVPASTTARWVPYNKSCGCDNWHCGQQTAQAAGAAFLPRQPQVRIKPPFAQAQWAQPVQPAAQPQCQGHAVQDAHAWPQPAVAAYQALASNAGVRPTDNDLGYAPRLPEMWTWEHHYTPLERTLLQIVEDTNFHTMQVERMLNHELHNLRTDLFDMKTRLDRSYKEDKLATVNALIDVIQVLCGARQGPTAVEETDEDGTTFSDLPPLVDHEGRLTEGEYKGMPPLVDTVTGESIYSDRLKEPATTPFTLEQEQHLSSLKTAAFGKHRLSVDHLPRAQQEVFAKWDRLLFVDAAEAAKLLKQVVQGPNPPASRVATVEAVVALAYPPPVPALEEEDEEEDEETDMETEMDTEPFEPAGFEDTSSITSSCTLEDVECQTHADVSSASTTDGSTSSMEDDLDQFVNAPDSTSTSSSSIVVGREVTPSSPVFASSAGEGHSEHFERVLAELQVEAENRKKRTRSVFEIFGTSSGGQVEEAQEQEYKAVEEEDQEENDETRLLRLQLKVLGAKLQLAKAMKRQAEERL